MVRFHKPVALLRAGCRAGSNDILVPSLSRRRLRGTGGSRDENKNERKEFLVPSKLFLVYFVTVVRPCKHS